MLKLTMKSMVFLCVLSFSWITHANAVVQDYGVKSELLEGVGSATLSKVIEGNMEAPVDNPANNTFDFTLILNKELNFGTLKEHPKFHFFAADAGAADKALYFAIDIANSQGGIPASSSLDVSFQWTAGADQDLGKRAGVTFALVNFKAFKDPLDPDKGTITEEVTDKAYLLANIGSASYSLKTLGQKKPSQWLRAYIGINTGDPNSQLGKQAPTDNIPITPSDIAGNYGGTLKITII